jgi:hypothetical protein
MITIPLHEKLEPIARVLLEIFPWIVPTEHFDFCFTGHSFGVILNPHCRIEVEPENQSNSSATIRFFPYDTAPSPRHRFVLNDPIEAMGIVSFCLPEWKQERAFQEPCFTCYTRNKKVPFTFPWDHGESLLISPSGKSYMYLDPYTPEWFQRNRLLSFQEMTDKGVFTPASKRSVLEVLEILK